MKKAKLLFFICFVLFYSTALCGQEITEEFLFEEIPMVSIATQSEHEVLDAPGTVTVVTGEQLKKMGISTLGEYFSRVPGFATSINYVRDTELEVRGIKTLFSEKIKFMIDGHSVNSPHTGSAVRIFSEFDIVPISYIKQVEIIRGPGSALYGTSAFLAVINIITKNPDDINGVSVKFFKQEFGFETQEILFGNQWGDFGISGSMEFKDKDYEEVYIESDALGQSGYTNSYLDSKDINLKTNYKDFTLFFKHYDKSKGPYVGYSYMLNDETNLDFTYSFAEINFEKQIFEKINFFSKVYYNNYDFDLFYEVIPNRNYVNVSYEDMNIGSEIRVDREIMDKHHVTLGAFFEKFERKKLGVRGNFLTLDEILDEWFEIEGYSPLGNWNKYDAKQDIFALYFQDEINEIIDNVKLTIGCRYDNYSISGSSFNWRTGINWKVADNTTVKCLYGKAFRAPTFEELYNTTVETLVGNENLKPEIIQTVETGIYHYINDLIQIDINFFYSEIKDLISTSGVKYENTGEVESFGSEIEIKGHFNKNAGYYANYSFADTEDKLTGEDRPNVAKHKANIGGDFKISQNININANFYVCGKKSRAKGDPRDDVDSYTKLDTTVLIQDLIPGLEISVSVKNLFDTTYYDPSPNALTTGMYSDFPVEGRLFSVSVEYKF